MRKRHINFTAIRSSSPSTVALPLERHMEELEGIEDRKSSDGDTIVYNQSDSDATEQSGEEETAEEAGTHCRIRSGRMIKIKAPIDYNDL